MNINFLKLTKFYYVLSCIAAVLAVAAILFFGLNLGIDFTGGSILEISFDSRPENSVIQEKLNDLNLGDMVIQPTGESEVIIRTKEIDESTRQEIFSRLNAVSGAKELRFENIGPTIGKELTQKTITLVLFSLTGLLIYIIIAFRKVSFPVSGFKYGLISIIALTFDILITVGIFAVLGKYNNVQFTIPIITALLTILGYTINDKVIVFDRVRENLLQRKTDDFQELVNKSLNQTLSRSLSTGMCSLFVLISIFFFGGETLKYFALALFTGIIVGTYSSLFLASPLLVSWSGSRRK
jgi:preprotein translocase subunit SecF